MVPLLCLATVLLAPPQDQERMQGTWAVEKAEQGGEPVPETDPIYAKKIVFEGDRMFVQGEADRNRREMTITLDAAKQPKEIDATVAGKVLKGIYEIDGDKLRINLGGPTADEPRPKEFATKAEGGASRMLTLRRVKQ